MTTIVIATDGSPEAHEAVEYGLELAAEEDADAVLLQVMSPVDWTRLDRGGVLRPVGGNLTLQRAPALEAAAERAAARGGAARAIP